MISFNVSIPFIVVCITKKAIIAERTATSLAFFAIPKATAAANINGKITRKSFKKVPFPKIASKCNEAIVVSLVNELPIPENNPAIGNTAIGSIKLRPILCKILNTLVFILSPILDKHLYKPIINIIIIISS